MAPTLAHGIIESGSLYRTRFRNTDPLRTTSSSIQPTRRILVGAARHVHKKRCLPKEPFGHSDVSVNDRLREGAEPRAASARLRLTDHVLLSDRRSHSLPALTHGVEVQERGHVVIGDAVDLADARQDALLGLGIRLHTELVPKVLMLWSSRIFARHHPDGFFLGVIQNWRVYTASPWENTSICGTDTCEAARRDTFHSLSSANLT